MKFVEALQSPQVILNRLLKLQGFQSKYFETPAAKIHYFEKKVKFEKGRIILIHGLGASAGHYFRVMPVLVKAGFSVFAPDLPGHGESSDHLKGELTLDMMIESLEKWINHVAPQAFILIGNSLGGGLSLKYALNHPGRLTHLGLVSPAGGFTSETDYKKFQRTIQFRTVEEVGIYLKKLYHKPPLILPLLQKSAFKNLTRKGVRELIESIEFKHFEIEKTGFKHFPKTLLIWGESEKVFPAGNLEWFRSMLPSSTQFEFGDGIGHCPQLENPKWLAKKLLEFVRL